MDVEPKLYPCNLHGSLCTVPVGDTDPCVSYEGTRTAIESLTSPTAHRALSSEAFQERAGGAYRPWFYNSTAADDTFMHAKPLLFGPALSFAAAADGALFGGHVVDYSHNLSFVTVHGSGHMVPQFRPQAALRLLQTVPTHRFSSCADSCRVHYSWWRAMPLWAYDM